MDFLELQRAIKERPTLPKYQAGKALGLGRRLTDQFVADGKMPVVGPKGGSADGVAPSGSPDQIRNVESRRNPGQGAPA